MAVFDDIKTGLEQEKKKKKGELKARKTTLTVLPVETFTPCAIKKIRKGAGMTQAMFAKYMGVSVKTVEAWEAGRNHPEGAACRMLALTRNDPDFPMQSGIVAGYADAIKR